MKKLVASFKKAFSSEIGEKRKKMIELSCKY